MNEDLDALLRDHYRRAAENIQPDADLIDRYRNVSRPARVLPGWVRILPAAAAAAAIALAAWSILRIGPSTHHDTPIAPPPTMTTGVPSPASTGLATPEPVHRSSTPPKVRSTRTITSTQTPTRRPTPLPNTARPTPSAVPTPTTGP